MPLHAKNSNDQEPKPKRQRFEKPKTIANDLWPLILEFASYEGKWIFQDFALVCKFFNTICGDTIKSFGTTFNSIFTDKDGYSCHIWCSATCKRFNLLVKLKNLRIIGLARHGVSIDEFDAEKITNGLVKMKQLKKVYLGRCDNSNSIVEILESVLENNKQLQSLVLCIDSGFEKHFGLLKEFQQLKKLELYGVVCGTIILEGVRLLGCVLSCLKNLKTLYLLDVGLDSNCMEELALTLKNLKSLKKLDLFANRIYTEGAKALGNVLPFMKQLQVLNLRCTFIEMDGLNALTPGLKELKQLRKLNLCNNDIEGALSSEFISVVKELQHLEHLDLQHNRIENLNDLIQAMKNSSICKRVKIQS